MYLQTTVLSDVLALWDTEEKGKIGAVHATEWCFGPEDLVITKLLKLFCKKV
jgi:hypothetical protein